jgi:LAS superfamily LD-carboxypeptidase LdcB
MLVVALAAQGCSAATGFPWVLSADADADPARAERPAIGKLDPELLAAVRDATRDARADGVRMVVTSGWRSREHQQRLLAEAISRYGSEEEALRYVATPDTSAHVTGDAVDIGPTEADDWLIQHGSDYGLCQIFANEIWHFELATAPGGRCPEMFADSSSRG